MIIVPNSHWQPFRYLAVRATDLRATSLNPDLETLDNSFFDFDLKKSSQHTKYTCKPASIQLPVLSANIPSV
jgi:hypothetical protein